jgi:hypothetical protein
LKCDFHKTEVNVFKNGRKLKNREWWFLSRQRKQKENVKAKVIPTLKYSDKCLIMSPNMGGKNDRKYI